MVLRIFGRAFRNISGEKKLVKTNDPGILSETRAEEKPVLDCIPNENILYLKPHWLLPPEGDEVFQEGDDTLRGEASRGIVRRVETPSGDRFGIVEETEHAWFGYLCRSSSNGIWTPAIVFRQSSIGYGETPKLASSGKWLYPGWFFATAGASTLANHTVFIDQGPYIWPVATGATVGCFFYCLRLNLKYQAFEQLVTTNPESKKIWLALHNRL